MIRNIICENLVFNKIEEAIDGMLACTNYERAFIETKNKFFPPPRKPRCKHVNRPRKEFDYDSLEPKPPFKLPCPTSDAARNHVHNPYVNSRLTHERILTICADSSIFKDSLHIDCNQAEDQYPNELPHFIRGCDSAREYITSLFTNQIAIYDGAMGTMIQNYYKRNQLDEEEYIGEKIKDWTFNINGDNDMLSISRPYIISGIYKKCLEVGGSNMIGTNTFSFMTIAMVDYEMENHVYEKNYEEYRLAREACDEVTAQHSKNPRLVVDTIGPTNRTVLFIPLLEYSSVRNETFEWVG